MTGLSLPPFLSQLEFMPAYVHQRWTYETLTHGVYTTYK